MLRLFEWIYGEVPVPNLLQIGLVGLIVFALFGGLWFWLGEIVIVFMLALLVTLAVLLQATLYFIHHQLEAIHSLHHLLDINAPLPAFRSWNVTPDLAAAVTGLILQHKPDLIVEVGGGLSSIVAGYAVKRAGKGRVVSYEHVAKYAAQTQAMLAQHGLSDVVTVRHAPLQPVTMDGRRFKWYEPSAFEDLQDIDLLFIDGPPNTTNRLARYPAVPILMDRLSADAVIVLDDAERKMEQAAIKRWLSENPSLKVIDLGTKGGSVMIVRGDEPQAVQSASYSY